ncbi:dATP/dGTP diphosphohydrolase domain-containing protein [Paraburkholderia graminis]|uniref:dATP/dGTP diphosphohydrolase domain-containing protein n=1 Tax=Paraburkholderia graminis TaxID=60548 RepID=UPI0038BD7756
MKEHWQRADENQLKDTNPKDAIGSGKLPLHLWPATASALGSLGLLDGMLKYGRSNWRVAGVRASIYVDAAKRHLDKWFEGQDNDADSGLPHFAHALACMAILVDAQAAGKLNDDRMVAGGYLEMLDDLTPHVARLKALHAGKDPRHYTIADSNGMTEHAAREGDARLIAESNAEYLAHEVKA